MKSSSHDGETDGWKSGFGGLWGIRSLLLDRIERGLTCWIVNVASQAGGWLAEGADTSRVMSWLALEQHPSSSQLIILRRRSRRSRARTFARVHGRPAGLGGLSCISTLRAKSDRCKCMIDAFHGKCNQICGDVETRRKFASVRSGWSVLQLVWPEEVASQDAPAVKSVQNETCGPCRESYDRHPPNSSQHWIIWPLEQSQSTEHCCKKKRDCMHVNGFRRLSGKIRLINDREGSEVEILAFMRMGVVHRFRRARIPDQDMSSSRSLDQRQTKGLEADYLWAGSSCLCWKWSKGTRVKTRL